MTDKQQGIYQSRADLRTLMAYCTERDTLVRSIKTALVVGTLLALINHWQDFLSGDFSPHWIIPMLLTYLVPFSVATYGQVQGKRQRDVLPKRSEVS
ncbi:MAG TPA: nitrate/nitrite transporter NrtS [Ktedonobacteraceae bacterium]